MAPLYASGPFSWNGFYAGVNAGYGWGSVSSSNFGNPSGGMIGGKVGYNYQIGQFVGGLEADFSSTNLNASNSFYLGANKLTTGFMMTARARARLRARSRTVFRHRRLRGHRNQRLLQRPAQSDMRARSTHGAMAA